MRELDEMLEYLKAIAGLALIIGLIMGMWELVWAIVDYLWRLV